ncbi:MAG: hypothetical protein EA382_04590 [Spirochaetaceae bacterium]|nr:MAG: hypothetical protein EA382_04590 [Spirochaetaceae bacterium]
MRPLTAIKLMIPVLLFASGAIVAVAVAFLNAGWLRVVAVAIAWWFCCGAVMQLVDYPRKRSVYRRLVPQRAAVLRGRAPADLRSTLCGRCIIWALHDEPRVTGASSGVREGEEYA